MFRYFSKRNRVKRRLRNLMLKKTVLQVELDYWSSIFTETSKGGGSIPASPLYEQAERWKLMAKLNFEIGELNFTLKRIP